NVFNARFNQFYNPLNKNSQSNAGSCTVDNDTQISVVSPAEDPSEPSNPVDVTVTTPNGTSAMSSADQFTYLPKVDSISPTSGPEAGGTTVTITGSGFTGATAVSFGSTAGTDVTVVSDTQITVVSPAGSGRVDVTVTTSAGTSQTSTADQFTYTPVIVISGG
ncbi:MAG TPA: IPT/TIG domain-containing protein, partial [Ktedonobacteraceae bacterium]|nr:IPT/TIG domain-containing protein [Ktedonobacteraceae bacterium]